MPPLPKSLPATPLSFAATRYPSAKTAPGDVTHDVVLKARSGEESQGERDAGALDHPNVVRDDVSHLSTPLFPMMRLRARVLVCILTCLVVFL